MTGGRHISHHLSYSWIHKISILKLCFIPGTTEHSGISNSELLASLRDQKRFECIQSTSFNPNILVGFCMTSRNLYGSRIQRLMMHVSIPFRTWSLLAFGLRILKGHLLIIIFVLIKGLLRRKINFSIRALQLPVLNQQVKACWNLKSLVRTV